MQQFAAFLRGINVGGAKTRILMKELSQLCETLELCQIQTYIQSGNLVFESDLPRQEIQDKLSAVLIQKLGAPITVFLRTRQELDEILASQPFGTSRQGTHHIALLSERPSGDRVEMLREMDSAGDEIRIIDREVHLFCPATYSASTFSNAALEKILGVRATTRKRDTLVATSQLWPTTAAPDA